MEISLWYSGKYIYGYLLLFSCRMARPHQSFEGCCAMTITGRANSLDIAGGHVEFPKKSGKMSSSWSEIYHLSNSYDLLFGIIHGLT